MRPLPPGVERPLVKFLKAGLRSRTLLGWGQPSARWQAHSAFATKLTNSAPSSVRYGGCSPSSSRQRRSVRPERNSCAARQTTSGRSPGCETNSKSCSQISLKGRSVRVTGCPFLEEGVLSAVDEAALVAERQLEDLRWLEIRPGRIGEASSRRGEDLVAVVFLVGEQAHPLRNTLRQADFLGAGVFVLLAVAVRQPHGHNAHRTA